MAMLLKPTLVFVAAFLFAAAAADKTNVEVDVDVDVDNCGGGGGGGAVGVVPIKVGGIGGGIGKPIGFGKLGLNLDDEDKCCEELDKIKFDKEKIVKFLHKLRCLFRIYASKQLFPDIKEMLAKTLFFVVETIAKQKPDEMCRINKFLQKSAKVVDDACKENGKC